MQQAPSVRSFALASLLVAVGGLFAVSCGGDDDGMTDPGPTVASVQVTPGEDSIAVGESAQFSASATDGDGNSVSASFTWSSTNTSVASVDDQGAATGEGEGTAEIVAEADGAADSAELTVTASSASAASIQRVSGDGQTGVTNRPYGDSLVVEALDENGDPVSGVAISWTVASGSADLSDGTTTTGSDGEAFVDVTAGSSTGEVTVEASAEGADGSPVSYGLTTTTVLFEVGDNYFEDPEGRRNTSAAADIVLGDTVRWEWVGNNNHNVESGEGSGGSSGDGVPSGGSSMSSTTQSSGTFQFVPGVEGTWEFYCVVHPNQMYGSTFTVTSGSSSDVSAGGPGRADLEPGDVVRPEGSRIVFVYQGTPGDEE